MKYLLVVLTAPWSPPLSHTLSSQSHFSCSFTIKSLPLVSVHQGELYILASEMRLENQNICPAKERKMLQTQLKKITHETDTLPSLRASHVA